MSTLVKWLRRADLEAMLRDAGMPCSRGTIETLIRDESSAFPQPRRTTETAIRLWDRELVEAWIARSRCSASIPANGAGARPDGLIG